MSSAQPTKNIFDDTEMQTFALETYAKRSRNYLTRMLDEDGQPYFNVFWTEPAEAAHDWPDFGDVTSRQLQEAIMVRHMTGEEIPTEKLWLKKILSRLDPETGRLFRPKTSYSEYVANMDDQALILYALVTAYLDSRDERLRIACSKMVDTLLSLAQRGDEQKNGSPSGFILKSLMACVRSMNYEPALILAKHLVQKIFADNSPFTVDNKIRHGAHMHSTLRCLVGVADYALFEGDSALLERTNALYRYVKSASTRFGFLREVVARKGEIVACETCGMMDFVGLATTLADHGYTEYWGDVERVARNHLIESQVQDASWLKSDSTREDTEQFTWRDVGKRIVGGFAGWSSPNHILACKETLNAHWGSPELRDKTRAFQNCCGGSGTHALFIVWKNASRFRDGCLTVNLHIDKLLPQAEIRCYQPYRGLLTINLKESCRVKVRIPDFISPREMQIESKYGDVNVRVSENLLELGARKSGDALRITYPLPLFDEEFSIGNPGFRQYHYRATYKGDTVVRMEPLRNDYSVGYSEFEKKEVAIFYGKEGPGPLYQREHMLKEAKPLLAPIHMDKSSPDLWFFQ